MAIRRRGAGVFFSALIFLMSAAVAHADPTFVLAESQARAGDSVHFTITGADDHVTYEVEVADRDVLEGEADGDGGVVAGQFTMPDLGSAAKSVQVEAEIREDDDKTTVKRKLQYLGPRGARDRRPGSTRAGTRTRGVASNRARSRPRNIAPGAATAHRPSRPAAEERRSKRKRRQARERRAARGRGTTSEQSRSGAEPRRPEATGATAGEDEAKEG